MSPLYAVITHNVVALHAAPDGGAEMVSQAILGDNVSVLEENGEYARIQTLDDYTGWVWRGHLRLHNPALPAETQFWPFGEAPENVHYITAGMTNFCTEPGDTETLLTKLVLGTPVRSLRTVATVEGTYLEVTVPSQAGVLTGYVEARDSCSLDAQGLAAHVGPSAICALARRFVGTPYLWGGTTPFGFDCSGFVQRISALHNVLLPRDAYLQAKAPRGVSLPAGEPLEPGDLVFFCGPSDPRNRGITHVGMAMDGETYIHAVGKEGVILTRYDDPYYSQRYTYRGAWRYSPEKEKRGDA